MLDISEKLRLLRAKSGFSQTEIAEKLNITKPTYAAYEKGKDISVGTLVQLAKIFNISFESFFVDVSKFNVTDKVKRIPIISRVSAGTGVFGIDDILDWLEIPTSLCRNCDYATFIKGDSMEPKIYDGDLILVQKTNILENGSIGVFRLGEDVYCKKFYQNPITKETVLKSLNPNYKTIDITEEDDFYILGRVVCKIDYNF